MFLPTENAHGLRADGREEPLAPLGWEEQETGTPKSGQVNEPQSHGTGVHTPRESQWEPGPHPLDAGHLWAEEDQGDGHHGVGMSGEESHSELRLS